MAETGVMNDSIWIRSLEQVRRNQRQLERNQDKLRSNARWLHWLGWFDRMVGAPLESATEELREADAELRAAHAELLEALREVAKP